MGKVLSKLPAVGAVREEHEDDQVCAAQGDGYDANRKHGGMEKLLPYDVADQQQDGADKCTSREADSLAAGKEPCQVWCR